MRRKLRHWLNQGLEFPERGDKYPHSYGIIPWEVAESEEDLERAMTEACNAV